MNAAKRKAHRFNIGKKEIDGIMGSGFNKAIGLVIDTHSMIIKAGKRL
jgi:hypothetical protein